MIKEVLQSLSGVEIFPIISLLMFFVMFTIVCFWAFSLDKKVISEMEQLPFENDFKDGEKIDV